MKPDIYRILLSFDTEEFDVPREHGVDISLEESIYISRVGTIRILDTLKRNDVKATFFCTTTFAKNAPDVIKRIIDEGHEVASHGCNHWNPCAEDVGNSKKILERLTGVTINGYRQPRMFKMDYSELAKSGYSYNSSLNPTFIPGKYVHLRAPRQPFMQDGVLQIPASVTPMVRFPLFWLSYHHLPGAWYRSMVRRTLRHDGYFTTYFHPWEFFNTGARPHLKLSFIHNRKAGHNMVDRLDALIRDLKSRGAVFTTFTPFVNEKIKELTQ